jgi:signal transduction histidine kinase
MADSEDPGGKRRPALSLRLRITLILAAINILTWTALAFYVVGAGRKIRSDLERSSAALKESTNDAVSSQLTQLLEIKVAEQVGGLRYDKLRVLPIELQKISYWDDAAFRRYVDKVALVRERADGSAEVFHPRSDLIFDHRKFEPDEALRLVKKAAKTKSVAFDGTRAAGQIRVRGEPWGGVYLSMVDVTRNIQPFDPFEPLRQMIVIAVLGTLGIAGAIYLFLAGSVIRPLEELGRVASAAADGDYSKRVAITGRRDEVGKVVDAQNRMMTLIQDYSTNMESRVKESVELIDRKNRELVMTQRLAAMGSLAAGIAHEINNPLGGMLNAVGRLRRTDLKDDAREKYIKLLEENIGRIGATVRRVLDLTPRRTTPGPISLPDSIQKVFDLVAWRASKKGVSLHLKVRGDVRQVLGDPNEIVQIFLNLVINAIDATESRGSVTLSLTDDGPWVTTAVRDTGTGMTPEVLARAFDPFFTTKEAGSGSGLGLPIVHGVVTSLGGTIEVASAPGAGTTFTVRLRPVGAEP